MIIENEGNGRGKRNKLTGGKEADRSEGYLYSDRGSDIVNWIRACG